MYRILLHNSRIMSKVCTSESQIFSEKRQSVFSPTILNRQNC